MKVNIDEEFIKLFKEYEKDKTIEEKILKNSSYIIDRILRYFDVSKNDYEDFVSEANIALLLAIRTYQYKMGTSFTNYAFTCIRNYLNNYLVTHKNGKSISVSPQELKHIKSDSILDLEEERYLENTNLYELIDKLPDKFREVIVLYYIKGYNIKDLECMLGVTNKVLYNRFSKALRILKQLYLESSLSKDEVIIKRFNNLKYREKLILIYYLKGDDEKTIAKLLNSSSVYCFEKIKSLLALFDCSIDRLKNVLKDCLSGKVKMIKDEHYKEKKKEIILNFAYLKDDYRFILVSLFTGSSLSDIADSLKMSLENVKKRILRMEQIFGCSKELIGEVLLSSGVFLVWQEYHEEYPDTISFLKVLYEEKILEEEVLDVDSILSKFLLLDEIDQESIILYLNGFPRESVYKIRNSINHNIFEVLRKKINKLGCSEDELRFSLARRK